MPDDPWMADTLAEHRRLVGPPEHPDVLTSVARGEDRLGTWELKDGPHPMPQDSAAVRHELILRRPGRGGSIFSGIGPRLCAGEIGRIGTAAHGDRDHRIGYIDACCQSGVAVVRVHLDDGSERDAVTTVSGATGLRWAVCPLDSTALADRVEFLDEQATVLESTLVRDPRTDL